MTRATGGSSQYEGYHLGPDIPWKPYHNKVHEYKPHTYMTVRPYDGVHGYRKLHEYNHVHEHTYREYKSSYRPEYRDYKLNINKKEPKLSNPPPPPKEVRKTAKKRYGDLHVCYAQPMGPDIRVRDYVYKEYQKKDYWKSKYQSTYCEYKSSTEPYINKKWTHYSGNVGYILTPHNHYPFRWGNKDKHNNLDENGNNITKESTQTSLSNVNPVVYVEEPLEKTEADAIEEEEPVEAETGLYRDPSIENTPFVEQEDDFYAAPLVVTDQVVTPLPINDPGEELAYEEDPEQPNWDEEENTEPAPIVAAVAAKATGGHTAPAKEAEDVQEDQTQETIKEIVDPVPDPVDNEPTAAAVVVAAAASSTNDDVVPAQENIIEEPVEESGKWSSLTTHGAGDADGNLTPVEAVVAGAVVGSAVASQQDPVQTDKPNAETVDPTPTNEAPTTESAAPEAETAAAPVQPAPVVATAAVVAQSAPSDAQATEPTNTGSRLPPEVVANIEAYNAAHASEISTVGTVKRTLDMMF